MDNINNFKSELKALLTKYDATISYNYIHKDSSNEMVVDFGVEDQNPYTEYLLCKHTFIESSHLDNVELPKIKTQRELLDEFINEIKDEFKNVNWDYLNFIADRVIAKQ